MKSNKHILLITPGFPADENDFNCIPPVQDFLVNFRLKYPEVKFTVISLHYPHKKKNYQWNGIEVFALGGKNSKIKKLFIWNKAIRRAKLINSEFAVSTVHSLWFGECALVGNFIANKLNCFHFCTLMGQDVKSSNKYLRFLKNKKIKIVSLSKNQSEMFNKLTKISVDETIHWGIEEQIFNNSERSIDLLGVGSLIPLKNYSLFVNAIAEIIPEYPQLKAVLGGSGPEESKLKRIITAKKLEKNIELKGLLSREEIFKLMRQSRIFVHPSHFEGSGFVFAEALANGMNVVSFNVGYARTDKKWFIAKDENDFIQLVKKLLRSDLDFSPTNLFPLSETVNRYYEIYKLGSKHE